MLIYLSFKTRTYAMLHDELANKWGLDEGGIDAPVFVGVGGDLSQGCCAACQHNVLCE